MPTLPLPRPRLRRAVPAGGVLLPGDVEVADPEIIEASGLRWIHIEEPRLAHREWLEKRFKFHALDFEDVYSRNQRPKLDSYDDYIFIVLQFPVFEKATGRLLSAELDIFVGPDYLITLPETSLPPLSAMFDRLGSRQDLREQNFSKGSGYLLYRIVDANVDAAFPMLRKMGNKLDRLEDDIFEGRSGEIVRDISNAKQEIINFRRSSGPSAPCSATSSGRSSATSPKSSRSTSTTSPTPPSASGTRSRTTRRSSRRSSRRTSRR